MKENKPSISDMFTNAMCVVYCTMTNQNSNDQKAVDEFNAWLAKAIQAQQRVTKAQFHTNQDDVIISNELQTIHQSAHAFIGAMAANNMQ